MSRELNLNISLAQYSGILGNHITVTIEHMGKSKFEQVQLEIFDTGLANRSLKLSFGEEPIRLGDSIFQMHIDLGLLPIGIYEIGLIIFHTPIDKSEPNSVVFRSGIDFNRQPFEIIDNEDDSRKAEKILKEVIERESELNFKFLAPEDIRSNKESAYSMYCAFVFVKNLLVGSHIRFDNYELIPTNSGLGASEELAFINSFIASRERYI